MIKITRPECPNPTALLNNYKHPDNKSALREGNNDKCMYCESKISHIDFAHVEHIKPKSDDKFPELKFDWNNLGYACPKCNNFKSNKYNEDFPHINPYEDDPNDFFYAFGVMLFVKNGSERAELSIIDTELNRLELLEKRQEKIDSIDKALKSCHRSSSEELRDFAIEELKKEYQPDKEYSFFIKYFMMNHDALNTELVPA